jgi:pilus assembly protein CpaD
MGTPMHRHRHRSRDLRCRSLLPALVLPLLLVAGCTSIVSGMQGVGLPVEDWENVRPIPQPQAGRLQYRHTVSFASGEGSLAADHRAALREFLGHLPAADAAAAAPPVFVVPGPADGALTEQRIAAIGQALAANRRSWQLGTVDSGVSPLPDTIDLIADVVVAVLPPCPDWSDWPQYSFSNRPMSNFGCATAINFGMMVADPSDLSRGRTPGPADGTVMSRSVERYRQDKTKELIRDSASSEIFPSSGASGK